MSNLIHQITNTTTSFIHQHYYKVKMKYSKPQIKILLNYLLLVVFTGVLDGQTNNIGSPFIQHYPKAEYNAGTQNWAFAQSPKGLLFIANNNGVLEFNNQEWILHPLPNKTITRSICYTPEGRLYAGGQDEIGYFQNDEDGFLKYHSLKQKIPAEFQTFEDVWKIVYQDSALFFRASDKIYRYKEDTITVFSTGNPITFLGKLNGQVVFQDVNQGLMAINEDEIKLLPGTSSLNTINVTALLPIHPDTVLITSIRNGILTYTNGQVRPWAIQPNRFLSDKTIQTATLLPNGHFVVGTQRAGMAIISPNGRIQHWLQRKDGLQNNDVRSLFVDQSGNIWLGLNNGVDYVLYSSPFRFFSPDDNLEGSAYAAMVHNNQFYCGTSNGLYATEWNAYKDPTNSEPIFKLIPSTEGQVWGLNQVNDALFLGHDKGGFTVNNNSVEQLASGIGNWLFQPLQQNPQFMICGTYYGLSLFKWEDATLQNFGYLDGFSESSRFVVQVADNEVWVSQPYRGVYQIELQEKAQNISIKHVNEITSLPDQLSNHVFKINNEVLICAKKGIYYYDYQLQQIKPHEKFNAIFGENTKVRRLVEDQQKNIWYVTEDEIGVLLVKDKGIDKTISKFPLPELENKLVGGFEFIYPLDQHNVFFGSEKGIIQLDPTGLGKPEPIYQPLITKVFLTSEKDSLLYGGKAFSPDPNNKVRNFLSTQNSLRFHFSTPLFSQLKEAEYQYKLEGFNEDWSEWTTSTIKEYTQLPPGNYQFLVRSRATHQTPTPAVGYAFYIAPPWYASKLAYMVYGLTGIAFVVSLIMIPQRRFKREKAQLKSEQIRKEAVYREEMLASENMIMELKNEKLTAEVDHKNRELAAVTMHLVQKNGLINKIATEMGRISQQTNESTTQKKLNVLIKLLDNDNQLDKDWEQFVYHFDQVHSDFFRRLRDRYPNLTPKDHKLCAYLRMNLSTKEIAPLLNISVRGVEISRYRLRKKLDIDQKVNLTEYIMRF